MFQVIVFSKPLEEMAELFAQVAGEAAWASKYTGNAVRQELVSLEDVLLTGGAKPVHQIAIRYFPDFSPNDTHFVFVGEEFTHQGVADALHTYVSRPAVLIDRTVPAQLMGAVMGHYYSVVDASKDMHVEGTVNDGYVTVRVSGVGILYDMMQIKAAIDKEA